MSPSYISVPYGKCRLCGSVAPSGSTATSKGWSFVYRLFVSASFKGRMSERRKVMMKTQCAAAPAVHLSAFIPDPFHKQLVLAVEIAEGGFGQLGQCSGPIAAGVDGREIVDQSVAVAAGLVEHQKIGQPGELAIQSLDSFVALD